MAPRSVMRARVSVVRGSTRFGTRNHLNAYLAVYNIMFICAQKRLRVINVQDAREYSKYLTGVETSGLEEVQLRHVLCTKYMMYMYIHVHAAYASPK